MEEIKEELEDPSILDDLEYYQFMVSLDKPRTENNETLHSVIYQPEENFEALLQNFQDDLKDLIDSFPEREQKILMMYYGIDRMRSYTLNEIGIEFDLTRERIRQIKEHVLEKLREKEDSNKLKDYYGVYQY